MKFFGAGRHAALVQSLLLFLALNALVRIGLTVWNGDWQLFLPWRILPAMLIGAGFDVAAAVHVLAPMALVLALWPHRSGRVGNLLLAGWALTSLCLSLMVAFVGVSEFTFWNEFASRFNFVAVDYLVYTNEVIGNIRQSYNLPALLGGVGLLALLISRLHWRMTAPAVREGASGTTLKGRLATALLWMLLPAIAWAVADTRFKDFSGNTQLNEIAGNGYYDFWHAFRSNEMDYERHYETLPWDKAVGTLDAALTGRQEGDRSLQPVARTITNPGPERPLNVVMVTMESMSALFLGAFGNDQGMTPNLDRLAAEGLVFTRMMATGTRTVRGLEALTLSIPPTPGQSIVKRPDNAGLFTLGGVLRSKGYESLFLYGGYGYFDNMNAFYSGNGYVVKDRLAVRDEEIASENIWGVADESLFAMALRELDERHARGQRFFAQLMTTSNHRPYTYPAGRIDIPSGTGREGGVKYTDYAVGQFVAEARKRPWFGSTVFVFVADHTHNGRGKKELPPQSYHIPCIIWAPGLIKPARIDTLASQIDVAPTLLGLLGMSYESRFFGQDILREGATRQRAFMANYLTVGYYADDAIVELKPNRRTRVTSAGAGDEVQTGPQADRLREAAISYYQVASRAYRTGALRVAP